MKDNKTSSAASSAMTSPSEPTRHPEHNAAEGQSESEYLARQAADAKAAMTRTMEDLKQSLKQSADPRYWTRKHPWAAVGAALAAGFVAANAVIPKKPPAPGEDRSRDDFEVLDGGAPSARPQAQADRTDAEPVEAELNGHASRGRKPSGLVGALTSPLFDLLKTVVDNGLMALVGTGVAAQAADQELDEEDLAAAHSDSDDLRSSEPLPEEPGPRSS